MSETRRIFTVGELTGAVKELIEEAFPDVWVAGEIGQLTRARSGHVYLSLKDEGAVLSAVIWRSTASRLRFDLAEGLEVLVRGRLNLYPPRGQYQLDVRLVEPRGEGALRQAFERLRARLAAEGLFDPERKRPLPFLPLRVGIVTSPTGAALQDLLQVLRRRFPGVSVLVAPVRVQGDGAAEEIARGLQRLDGRGDLDVLIVGRGGGSLEDLWAFNEEVVARAIAACRTPVVSAVGHEVDVSIADLVADLRAPTPSAAAELVVPEERELRAGLDGLRTRLGAALDARLAQGRERLAALSGRYGLRRLPDRIREHYQFTDGLARDLARGIGDAVSGAGERLFALSARTESLSPLRVLGRGYSVTTVEAGGAPLRNAEQVTPGEVLKTRLFRGSVISRVEEVVEEVEHG